MHGNVVVDGCPARRSDDQIHQSLVRPGHCIQTQLPGDLRIRRHPHPEMDGMAEFPLGCRDPLPHGIDPGGQQIAVFRFAADGKDIGLAEKIEFQAVDVIALQRLVDQPQIAGAHGRAGIVQRAVVNIDRRS